MTAAARRRRWARSDRGSATIQMMLLAPLLILFMLFVVLCGRLVAVKLDVSAAARAGARAASLARTPEVARLQATQAATGTLSARTGTCRAPQISVDTTAMRPGGTVTVTVTCTVPASDLSLLSVVGDRQLTASSTSPVDLHRGTG